MPHTSALPTVIDRDQAAAATELAAVGVRFDMRGLTPATSGNFSARLPDGSALVTRSGRHKGRLTPDDFMRVAPDGRAIDAGRPSAECALHLMIYSAFPAAGAVLHWHSPQAAALTRVLADTSLWTIAGHEMLKAFPGVLSHDTVRQVPIVDNSQDMAEIEAALAPALDDPAMPPLFLIRGHGAYAWGSDVAEAERVAEAAEWLVAAELAERQLRAAMTGEMR